MANSGLDVASAVYVVAAARPGTTAVWCRLRRHLDVFLADVKALGFFAFSGCLSVPRREPYDRDHVSEVTTSTKDCFRLYSACTGIISGDVSPIRQINAGAALLIAAVRRNARTVILLRVPVTRGFCQAPAAPSSRI